VLSRERSADSMPPPAPPAAAVAPPVQPPPVPAAPQPFPAAAPAPAPPPAPSLAPKTEAAQNQDEARKQALTAREPLARSPEAVPRTPGGATSIATPPAADVAQAPRAAPSAAEGVSRSERVAPARSAAAPLALRTAADYIARIEALLADSRTAEAAHELNAFRAAYPDADERLPEKLKPFAASVQRAAPVSR
jgi:hypothetical protein